MDTQSNQEGSGKKGRRDGFIPVVLVLLIVASSVAVFFYNEMRTLQLNPNKVNEEKAKAIVERVGNLIALPEDEIPTIATISDVSVIKGQPFFSKAKNGDEVLLYTAARKAFLYDPKANIIVEVAYLNIGR